MTPSRRATTSSSRSHRLVWRQRRPRSSRPGTRCALPAAFTVDIERSESRASSRPLRRCEGGLPAARRDPARARLPDGNQEAASRRFDAHLRDRHPQDHDDPRTSGGGRSGIRKSGSRVPVEERLFSLVLRAARDRDRAHQERRSSRRCRATASATTTGRRQREPRAAVRARQGRHPRPRRAARRRSTSPGEAGNNQTLRYRIPKGSLRPAARRATFTPEETVAAQTSRRWCGERARSRGVAARAAQAAVPRRHAPTSRCSATPRASGCATRRSTRSTAAIRKGRARALPIPASRPGACERA